VYPFTFLLAALALVGLSAEQADAQLSTIYRITNSVSASHVEYRNVELKPGQEMTLADLTGPARITYFYWTDDSHFHPTEGSGAMYEGLVLRMFWDDASEPSIQVPLWAFFAQFDHRATDFQSALMEVKHHCFMSYLPMPFSKHARITLLNDGPESYSRSAAWGVDYEHDVAMANESSRLHAAWLRSNPTRDSLHEILNVTGRGQYIGSILQVNTKYEGWWGEGDTLFEVDGTSYTHSPGTEDEYGSAWGFDRPYSSQYTGYIEMEQGRNRMYRWYVPNPVRFQKELKVTIQDQRFQNGQVKSRDDFTTVAFWYQESAHPAPPLPSFQERTAPSHISLYPHSH
jgi:Protein of unknown function (DUF2961)